MDIASLGLSVDSNGFVRADKNMARFNRTARQTEQGTERLTRSFAMLRTVLPILSFAAMAAAATSMVRTFSQFETALVGVSKTTGLVGRDLDQLASRIDQLSKNIPVTTSELLGMAQAAGQMGVTGADNLEKFSRTVAMLGRASNLAGEQAASALARILNVTGENISEVDVLASVIVSLGNNVAATESEIANMTTRVAQATAAFGISSAEAAALGAAMASVGVQAEAGGTAVGQAFSAITNAVNAGGAQLDEFADALGLNADMLASLFANDKVSGFQYFLEQVASLGDGAGLALENAGLGGVRLAQSLIPLGRNIGIYAETQRLANAETVNATALNREFEATLDTLGSQWQMTLNIAESFRREIGGNMAPALSSLLAGFNEWAREGDNVADTVDTLSTAIGALAFVYGVRLTTSLSAATASRVKDIAASMAQAKAAVGVAAANVAETQATLGATAAEVAALKVTHQAIVAQTNAARVYGLTAKQKALLAASTKALAAAEAANTAAVAPAIAAQNAHAAALTRASLAARAATASMSALRGATALLGGPAGLIMIAAGALIYFATKASDGEKMLGGFNNALDDTVSRFEALGEAQRRVALADMVDEIEKAEARLRKTQTAMAVMGAGNIQGGGGIGGRDEDRLLARIEAEQAAVDELREKYNTLAGIQKQATTSASIGVSNLVFELTNGALGVERFSGVLKTGLQDVPVMLQGVAKAAQSTGASIKKMSDDQIKSLEELEEKYRLNTELLGVTTSREEELIKMRRAGIDVTSALAKEVLAAAEAYDQLLAAQGTDGIFKGLTSGLSVMGKQVQGMEKVLALAKQLADEQDRIADAVGNIQRAADPAFAALQDYQTGMDTLAEGLLNNIIDDQQFVALADHLLQVRDAALEAAKGMSWLDKLDTGLGGVAAGLSQIHSTMDSGSKSAEKLGVAMQALAIAQGIVAVINQGTGDPYTAFARMAAMAASIAALGVSIGGMGGSGPSVSEERHATQGTGTVFGDAEAKSDSIAKATEITADATRALVGINRAQLQALEAMSRAITGVTEGLIRSGGIGAMTSGMQFGGQAVLGRDAEYLNPLAPLMMNESIFGGSELTEGLAAFHSGLWNDINKELFRVDTDLVDSGIMLFGGAFSDIIDGSLAVAQQYADITKEKKLFGIGLGESAETILQSLGEETSGQILSVLSNMGSAVTAGAQSLGIAEDVIAERLAGFELAMQQISLKDLSAEEQQAELEAVFSSIFDDLSLAVVPYLEEFARVGEGFGETMARIATQTQVAQEAMSQLGSILMDDLAGKAVVEMSDALISAAGGMESFITGFTGFVDKFATDEHKLSVATTAINSAMSQLGLEVPQSEEALWDLMQTLTDPAQIAGLLRLQDSFVTMFNASEQAARATERLAQEERDLAQARVDSAVQATNAAMNQLRASVQAQKDIVGETYNAAVAAEEARASGLIDAANAAFESRMSGMQSWADRTRNSMQGLLQITAALESAVQGNIISTAAMEQAQRRGAQAVIARALATGNLSGVEDAARTLQSGPVGGSRVDRQFDAAVTANQLQALADRTGAQASVQEQTLAALDRRIAQAQTNHEANISAIHAQSSGILGALEMGYNDELSRLDAIVNGEQERMDLMRGIDNNIYSIDESLSRLDMAMSDERQARMEREMVEMRQASQEQLAEMKAMRQDWQRIKEREFEEMGAQTNIEEDQRKLLADIKSNTAA